MGRSLKRKLSEIQGREATVMINKGSSLGKVARYFGVNKPTILKALGVWETGVVKLEGGREYQMKRGRMIIHGKGIDIK